MELEAAVKRFQELRSREQQLLTKITEMAAQESEYRHVSTCAHLGLERCEPALEIDVHGTCLGDIHHLQTSV